MAWAATLLALLVIGALPGIAGAQSGIISTVAGTGIDESSGDDGAAALAGLYHPYGLALDAAGNLYIAEYSAHRIRKVSAATGIITTVAGTGDPGSLGDGGQATLAQLTNPIAVTVSPAGDLYISEYEGARVRRVDGATGVITTVAGNGVRGYGGDGLAATAAQLNGPWGLAVDGSGHLYIADQGNHRIRKVDAATGLISTYAGDGAYSYYGDDGLATAAALRSPLGIDLDSSGNLYIADYANHRIRKVTAATGIITTVAGNGGGGYTGDGVAATATSLFYPYDVQVDLAGNLYIADTTNNRIRYVSAATGLISTMAGGGSPGFSGDGGLATEAALNTPVGLAISPANDVYLSDEGNARVRMITGRALPVITWANPASIVYGTALSATQLNATANVAGTFIYDPATGTVLSAGTGQTLSVTFTPDDLVTYAPATKTVLLDVQKAVAPIDWAVPAAVPPGTVLGAAQLNATSTLPGSFEYTPPAGTVVNATLQLFVTFTPDDTANYSNGNADVQLTVLAGPVNGPPYTLTITPPTGGKIQGAGINCGAGGAACTVTMPASMTIGLSATASAGYTFTNWTGDCAGTTASQWLSLAGPRSCSAVFTPVAAVYTLTIAPVPTGGTVTGNGLACGTGGAACDVTFGGVTTAALTAAPDAGFVFAGWGGACSGTNTATTVAVNAAKTCTATFTASGGGAIGPPYTLTVTPPAGGKVQGAGINCGAGGTACSVTMPASMTIGLSATASEGYTFAAWTGDCTGTAASQWLLLKGPRTCGATFTATGGGGGGGTPEGGIIETVAGTGEGGYGGDGGLATETAITPPRDVAIDGAGNMYIADLNLHAVRKVDAATGIITTVAGTGAPGYNGDGILAASASLNLPYSVATDAAGNLYIADYANSRVRKVDAATGIITTYAGTGVEGFSGDLGPATEAQLDGPYQVALDGAGNLFITDNNNVRVRRVDAATGIITTYAGMGMAGYGGDGGLAIDAPIRPAGLALDASGNLFIAESDNKRVRKVTAATGIIATVAGTGIAGDSGDGGLATAATLNNPVDVAVDADGNLYIADSFNFRVRRVAAATGIITTYAGTGVEGFSGDGGPATEAQISYPYGLEFDSAGHLYIADNFNLRIRRVAAGSVAPVDGPPYTLTVTPPTGGKIQGAGINCGAGGTACSVTMPAEMTLGLSATASSGYTFGGWTGDCTGTSPGLWLALKGARTCSATFTAVR